MSEEKRLHQDELRRACEIVRWQWHTHDCPDRGPLAWAERGLFFHSLLRGGFVDLEDEETALDGHAVALLKATGRDFEVQHHRSGWSVGFMGLDWLEHESDLPTAAVRAVLRTAGETPGERHR